VGICQTPAIRIAVAEQPVNKNRSAMITTKFFILLYLRTRFHEHVLYPCHSDSRLMPQAGAYPEGTSKGLS
jgi:hypothetical protein